MSTLEAFGARTNDEGHFAQGELESPTIFFDRARSILRNPRLHGEIMSEVVPHLERFSGKWHPIGFQAYHLGVNRKGYSLRLHIWPEGERRKSEVGPHIHDHAWHLASRVLAGTYVDNIYTPIEIDPDHDGEEGDMNLRVFNLAYGEHGQDTLRATGVTRSLRVISRRTFEAGRIHTIRDGVTHLPVVPEGSFAATLVVDAPSTGRLTNVYIDTDRSILDASRVMIDPTEAVEAKYQLLQQAA
jgi:hypothetical protein